MYTSKTHLVEQEIIGFSKISFKYIGTCITVNSRYLLLLLNVLLTGSKLWRYSGFTLDAGYPKRLSGWFRGIQAALIEDSGEIRVLKVTRTCRSIARVSAILI